MPLDASFLARYFNTDTADVPVLEALLAAEVSRVEIATGRLFEAPSARSEYYDGDGDVDLELRAPVTTGTPIVSIAYGAGDYIALDSSFYFVDVNRELGINNLLVLKHQTWPIGHRNVKVDYTGGFGTGSGLAPPPQIFKLIADLVGISYRARLGATVGTDAQSGEIPKHLAEIVDRWRIRRPAHQVRLVRA